MKKFLKGAVLGLATLGVITAADVRAAELETSKTVVSFTIAEHAEVVPDTYRFQLTASVVDESGAVAVDTLGRFDRALRDSGVKFKKSSWRSSKEYRWEKGRRIFLGVKAAAHYDVRASGPSDQTRILKVCREFEAEGLVCETSLARWELSPEKIERIWMKMRKRLLERALAEAKSISSLLAQKCSLKEVDFSRSEIVPRPYPVAAMKAISHANRAVEPPKPQKGVQTVDLTASVRVECSKSE